MGSSGRAPQGRTPSLTCGLRRSATREPQAPAFAQVQTRGDCGAVDTCPLTAVGTGAGLVRQETGRPGVAHTQPSQSSGSVHSAVGLAKNPVSKSSV